MPATDLVIAAAAIKYDYTLWHDDGHFEVIAQDSALCNRRLSARAPMATTHRLQATSVAVAATALLVVLGCRSESGSAAVQEGIDSSTVAAEVEAAVWAFHAADTARDAEAVLALLWPDYTMLVDGRRTDFGEIAASSREFMASLDLFHTVWSGLRVIPIGSDAALASFVFRDSIIVRDGELIRAQGPTTLLWERRNGEWRIRFGDADHYPIDP